MHMSEKESASTVDQAIDRAVRHMVRIDPRPGLEMRVRSRLAVPPPRRSIYSSRLIAFGAALAMLVLVAGLLRSGSTPVLVAPTVTAPQQVPGGEPASARVEPLNGSGPASGPGGSVPAQISRQAAVGQREPVKDAPRSVTVARAKPTLHAETISMPPIANLFGPGGNRVSGANFLAANPGGAPVLSTDSDGPPIAIADLPMPVLRIEPLRIAPIAAPGKER
jgi:hypothetical protein